MWCETRAFLDFERSKSFVQKGRPRHEESQQWDNKKKIKKRCVIVCLSSILSALFVILLLLFMLALDSIIQANFNLLHVLGGRDVVRKNTNDVVIGTASGDLYIFDCQKRRLKSIITAHKKAAVLTMTEWKYAAEQGNAPFLRIITGSRDGAVHFWSDKWGKVGQIVTLIMLPYLAFLRGVESIY